MRGGGSKERRLCVRQLAGKVGNKGDIRRRCRRRRRYSGGNWGANFRGGGAGKGAGVIVGVGAGGGGGGGDGVGGAVRVHRSRQVHDG